MKNSEVRSWWTVACLGAAMTWIANMSAVGQTEGWQRLNPAEIPATGTFFGAQDSPPWPFLPHPEWKLPVYRVTTSNSLFYVFDDRMIDYSAYNAVMSLLEPPGWEGGGGGEYPGGDPLPATYDYPEGAFWIEIFGVENDFATLGLHNVPLYSYGQILSRTNIEDNAWKFGPILQNYDGTNLLMFDSFSAPVLTYGLERQFYRGVQGFPVVSIQTDYYFGEAREPTGLNDPPGDVGIFNIFLSDSLSTNLTVQYLISGTASDGVDYTNLSGAVTIGNGTFGAQIYIHPLYDTLLEFEESVTLTLILTNGYLVNPNYASATIWIKDNIPTNVFQPVVANLNSAVGIDYHAPSNALLVSLNFPDGIPNNFIRVYTNGTGTVVTNWSGIAGELDEVKLASVKQTLNGFTNGDLFFGSDSKIGWLSADGTRSNLTLCVLTNGVVTNALHLWGSLYVDQTGVFSNNLVAVTSGDDYAFGPKGVWMVGGNRQPRLLANIPAYHLEGLITLTNDVNHWGPWANKLLTGDEYSRTIYAVDTNGVVTTFDLGIDPEDFDFIPPNQDLYCANLNGSDSRILKISSAVLTNYVGDLLITQAGEYVGGSALFIVHWNGTGFETRRISLPNTITGEIEHVTFAPLSLPTINP